tara:strand:+ start:10386 stop:11570 length:1185 start_codon:yes stop_codon:yes gene_type:complete
MQNKIVISLSLLFCFTYPGIQHILIDYLNVYFVKFFSLFFLLIQFKYYKDFFTFSYNKKFFFLISFMFLYKFFYSPFSDIKDLTIFLNLIWVFLLFISIKTNDQFQFFLKALFLTSSLVVISAGIDNIFDLNRNFFIRSYVENNSLTGFTNSYIVYSLCSLQCLFLSIYFYRRSNGYSRFFYLFLIFASLFASITSGSRGSALVAVLSLSFYFVMSVKINNKKLFSVKHIYSLIFLLIISSFVLPYEVLLNEFSRIFEGNDLSASRRLSAGLVSLNSFYENPLFGSGWGYTRQIIGIPSHSMILQLLGELGILGLFLEFSIYFLIFKLCYNLYISPVVVKQETQFLFLSTVTLAFGIFIWCFFENLGFVFGDRIIYTNVIILFLIYKIYFYRKI